MHRLFARTAATFSPTPRLRTIRTIRTIPMIASIQSFIAVLLAAGTALPVAAAAQTAPSPAMAAGLATADSLVQAAVASNLIPGAVLVVSRNGKVLQNRAFGYAELYDFDLHRLAHPRPMHTTTMFDLASVTKVMATTFAVMM